jgi:hypothetical protein
MAATFSPQNNTPFHDQEDHLDFDPEDGGNTFPSK